MLAGVSYRNAHVSDCLGREDPIDQVIPTPEEYSYDPDRIVYAWRAQAAACLVVDLGPGMAVQPILASRDRGDRRRAGRWARSRPNQTTSTRLQSPAERDV